MRKLFTSLLISLLLLICNVLSAQETVKHVVQKGETISSIASNYGVTVAEITTLNPKAAKFVFVGMELLIPVKNKLAASAPDSSGTASVNSAATVSLPVTQQTQTPSYTSDNTANNRSYTDDPYKNQQSSGTTHPTTVGHIMAGYILSLEDKPEGTTAWGVSIISSVDEYFNDMLYAGLGVGLDLGGATYKYKTYKSTSMAYQLDFPVYFGITPVKGIDIDTGPSFNWLVGGGTKEFVDGEKISESKFSDDKELKRFSPTWRVSVRLINYLHVSVNIGLKKNSGTSMTFGLSF